MEPRRSASIRRAALLGVLFGLLTCAALAGSLALIGLLLGSLR
ncbi:hypothetical protein [Thermomicrobium sp.]